MARFPAWISKTQWRKLTPQQQANGLSAMRLLAGEFPMEGQTAAMRGVPEREPSWIKGTPDPLRRHADLGLLERRTRRRMVAAARASNARQLAKDYQQARCRHEFPPLEAGMSTVRCPKCGKIA